MKRGYKFVLLIFLLTIFYVNSVSAVDWLLADSGTEHPLFGVSFANERTAWAVGGAGLGYPDAVVMLKTEDGGVTWTPQDVPTTEQLLDVCFVDEEVGWAIGIGVVIFTDDGGDTWIEQDTPYDAIFDDISCVDRDTAYIVGSVGRPFDPDSNILKLVSGDWTELSSGFNLEWYSSHFFDENTGYVVGQDGRIVKTTDGMTFIPVARLEDDGIPSSLNGIHCFLNENECWIADSNERVYHTSDGWESWDQVNAGDTVSGMGDIFIRDVDSIWVVGQSALRHTDDGGLTWINDDTEISNPVLEILSVAFMRDVEFFGNVGLAVGDDGTILRYGTPAECPIIENTCEDAYAITYNETTGCISGYLCVLLPEGNRTLTIPETCQSQYWECLEENYPNHADCDETFEFCDGIDELLEEFQEEQVEKAFDYAAGFEYFINFLENENINIYLTLQDGGENVFGLDVNKNDIKVIEPNEKPTISIYLSENILDQIVKSEEPRNEVLAALKSGEIKIKGNSFGKKVKVFFFNIAKKFLN